MKNVSTPEWIIDTAKEKQDQRAEVESKQLRTRPSQRQLSAATSDTRDMFYVRFYILFSFDETEDVSDVFNITGSVE